MKLHIWTVRSKLGHRYRCISPGIFLIYSRPHTHIYTFLTHFRTFFYSWMKSRYSVHFYLSTCEYLTKNFIMCTKKQTCILLYLLQILIHFSNGKEFSFEKVNSQISKSTYLLKGKTNFYRGQHRYRFEWSAYSKIILIFFLFEHRNFLNLKTYMEFFLVRKYLEKFSIFFDFEIFLKSSYFC